MSRDSEDSGDQVAALEAELDGMRRREASFRSRMVQEFLDRGERNTYLRTLHEERAALAGRAEEAPGDMKLLVGKLDAERERAAALQTQIAGITGSWAWRIGAPIRALGGLFARAPAPATIARLMEQAPAEGGIFTYYLHTSPFRIFRGAAFTLRGWVLPQDGSAVTGVRVNLGGRLFVGRVGLDEPEVIARHGPQAKNPSPGFEVAFETPPGRHMLSLEANLEGTEWRSIVTTPIWCVPAPR